MAVTGKLLLSAGGYYQERIRDDPGFSGIYIDDNYVFGGAATKIRFCQKYFYWTYTGPVPYRY